MNLYVRHISDIIVTFSLTHKKSRKKIQNTKYKKIYMKKA
jgi:hypothetical protein